MRVRGGYSPSRIHARPGVPVRLIFDRQESGDCTSRVVFPGLGISADLPAFAETAVDLPAQAPGEYGFACGMNMIHGLLSVDGKPGQAGTAPAGGDTAAAAVTAAPSGPAGRQAATVIVDGGYHPDRVLALAGAPLRLEFDRREEGACSEHVVFPGLGIEADLAARRAHRRGPACARRGPLRVHLRDGHAARDHRGRRAGAGHAAAPGRGRARRPPGRTRQRRPAACGPAGPGSGDRAPGRARLLRRAQARGR